MIKPNECLTVQDKQILKDLEEKIDNYLRYNYMDGERLYLGGIINLPEGKIRTSIIEKYRNGGWDVWFVPSTVDGLPEGPYFIEKGKRTPPQK